MLYLPYTDQLVNAVWVKNFCLLCESYATYKYTVWSKCRVSSVKLGVTCNYHCCLEGEFILCM